MLRGMCSLCELLKLYQMKQRKADADEAWTSVEHLKPWNDACTKFCTLNYFPDATSRSNDICNVIRPYDRPAHLAGRSALPEASPTASLGQPSKRALRPLNRLSELYKILSFLNRLVVLFNHAFIQLQREQEIYLLSLFIYSNSNILCFHVTM